MPDWARWLSREATGQLTPQEQAMLNRARQQGLAPTARSTEEMIATEGGGLQERPGPAGLVAGAALAPVRAGAAMMSAIPSVMEAPAEVAGSLAGEAGLRLTGEPRAQQTPEQMLLQTGLGVGGAMGGTALGGRLGGAAGAAGGTFLGGVLAGRSPMNALIDAIEQGGLEYAGSGVAQGIGNYLTPKVSAASRQALTGAGAQPDVAGMLQGGPRPTQAQFGQAAEQAMGEEFQQASGIVRRAYARVRQG